MKEHFQAEGTIMSINTETQVRELDRRVNDGFDVRLLWSPETNRVFITVEDQRHGDSCEFETAATDALEAFHHPFAYAADAGDSLPEQPERLPAAGCD
jgi:hypothetical protein